MISEIVTLISQASWDEFLIQGSRAQPLWTSSPPELHGLWRNGQPSKTPCGMQYSNQASHRAAPGERSKRAENAILAGQPAVSIPVCHPYSGAPEQTHR